MRKKYEYWQDYTNYDENGPYGRYWLVRCPKCHKGFYMPKEWGVWKGCPICWIELKFKKGKKQ